MTLKAHQPGPISGDIVVHLAGEGGPPTLIPFSGRVASLVEVSPTSLVLPLASGAGPVYHGKCICRSPEGKPLTLTVASVPKGLSTRVETVGGNLSVQIVRIEWDPAQGPGPGQESPRVLRLQAKVGDREVPLAISVHCRHQGGS